MSKGKQNKNSEFRSFDSPDADSTATCVIEVDGKKLYVHKEYVSQFSKNWKKDLYSDEKSTSTLLIKGRKVDDIKELLQCIYPPFKKIDSDNCERIMEMALEYKIKHLQDRVALYLKEELDQQIKSKYGGASNIMMDILQKVDRFELDEPREVLANWYGKQNTSKVRDAMNKVTSPTAVCLATQRMNVLDRKLREAEKKNKDLETKLAAFMPTAQYF